MTRPERGAAAVLRALCRDGASRATDPDLRAELTAAADRLDRPLQLAIAGAVSAGKSTLINAILGRSVAAVDAGECTRIVTWYEYGPDPHVLVQYTNGDTRRVPLGATDLTAADIARLRVRLPDPWLRTVTVIDTPGLNTVSSEDATRALLFGDAAAEHAQALIYVLRYVQRFDADTLAEFRGLSVACGLTAVNTAAVLSQVDRRADEADPWPVARRLTARAAAELGPTVLDVTPVIGLLAETGRAATLRPADLETLRELASLPEAVVEDLLLDLAEFTADPAHKSLVDRLHRYGITVAVDLLRCDPRAGLDEVHRELVVRSGFAEPGLVDVVRRFTRHADLLKAHAAVVRLRSLDTRFGTGPDKSVVARLVSTVEENRPLVDELAGLRALAACAALATNALVLDQDMTDRLFRLVRGETPAARLGLPPAATPAEIVLAARQATRPWRQLAQMAGPTVAGHRAQDVLATLEDIADSALDQDRVLIERLRDEPLLAAPVRRAVGALLDGEMSGVDSGQVAIRLRAMLHRPLPPPIRRAVEVACAAFENLAGSRP
ncbi:dynamin family protein [Actinokineospora cianjurensis]|uniref:Dynamin family protein n=1 Tax=Actinokineospora cianjurensis TaxID=585224 RepID=A0A421AUF8_9PSEU|nr:dynamin family protein [Actinokineospora cianjurensis]RLK53725.1 dynamin family protein [Actinokineospora cianjurensis]